MANPNRTRFDRRIKDQLRKLRARISAFKGAPEIHKRFQKVHGYPLNLNAPRTWNEKMQWRKLHDKNPLLPVISDKVATREFARSRLQPSDHWVVPPFLQVATTADQIDIAALPDDVILKPAHGSGWRMPLYAGEPRDISALQKTLRYWLDRSFGTALALNEQFYWPAKRAILVEPLLHGPQGGRPAEVKFHLFHDEIRFVTFTEAGDELTHVGVFDENWQVLPFAIHKPPMEVAPPVPQRWDDLCRIARQVGAGFDYIRVDFLMADGQAVLNEMSAVHISGYGPVTPVEYDRIIGDWWDLPANSRDGSA